jgi:hypothetical protein
LEGHYLLVNKNIVELLALVIFLAIPSDRLWGLDRLRRRWRSRKAAKPKAEPLAEKAAAQSDSLNRREALEDLAAVPLLGVLGYTAQKKYEWEKVHAVTGASLKLQNFSLTDLKGRLPQGTLGKLKMSRLILGGNLIGGYAHCRDLIYGPALFKAYNTDRKIFETLDLAERAGVDTFLLGTCQMPAFCKYRELTSSKMQTICQVMSTPQDPFTEVHQAIDAGGTTMYVQGAHAELFVKTGQFDLLGKILDLIRSQGYLAGLGGHSIEVMIQCEKAGLQPDYYVKTLHHDQYWSAHPRENRVEFSVDGTRSLDHSRFHDNMFDLFPEKTIEVMHGIQKPWIAFKVLAGGAIHPTEGFKFAFENGADFVCAGMFDFQIVEDVNIALDVLANLKNRQRAWYA